MCYNVQIIGLDTDTPNYLLAGGKCEELGAETTRRARKFEEKARIKKVNLVAECIKELKRERWREDEGWWNRKRKIALEHVRFKKKYIRKLKEEKEFRCGNKFRRGKY